MNFYIRLGRTIIHVSEIPWLKLRKFGYYFGFRCGSFFNAGLFTEMQSAWNSAHIVAQQTLHDLK